MSSVNQKEYLKRYLSKSGDKKKKKKKKHAPKGIQNRVKIIDDNIDVHEHMQTIQDIENNDEDAPQVVAVIDERPIELRLHQFKDSSNWTTIDLKPQIKTEPEEASPTHKNDNNKSNKRDKSETQNQNDENSYESDDSPPRRKKQNDYSSRNASSPNSSRRDDNSPPRKRQGDDYSPPRRIKQEEDFSPPRRRQKQSQNDSDESPPRRRKDVDDSPPRKRNSDSSPPRRKNQDSCSTRRRRRDNSPPRKRNDNNSPPRRKQNDTSSKGRERNSSPMRINRDHSPNRKKSRWSSKSPESKSSKQDKATKTLDGKTAGLQNAKDLVKETENFRKREAKLFESMSAEVSGVGSATVMRDRKTGKIRDLEAEAKAKAAHQEKANALLKQYDEWGKGVKQTTDYKAKLQQDAYEMSKPLARYADDEDLEKYLKEQERAEDPMLQYIRKKKRENAVATGVPLKPVYEGTFMPNRYGIRPGHKWDGVDRSNGYEKKWFDAINQRNAQREEAYKWNSEDM